MNDPSDGPETTDPTGDAAKGKQKGFLEIVAELLLIGGGVKIAADVIGPFLKAYTLRPLPPPAPPRPVQRPTPRPPAPAPLEAVTPPATPISAKTTKQLQDESAKAFAELNAALAQFQAQAQHMEKQAQLAEAIRAWLRYIPSPGVTVILGKLGGGKSALAYWLLELLRPRAPVVVVGFPDPALPLLPAGWGSVPSLDKLPHHCIALIDEAGLQFPAGATEAQKKVMLDETLTLCRQRDQTLIFVAREGRLVHRSIMSSASALIFRQPGSFQLDYERKELQDILGKAALAFAELKDDPRGWAYLFARDAEFAGMLRTALPSFWTEGLSRAFSQYGVSTVETPPKPMTRDDKVRQAKEMRAAGRSLRQIGRALGVSAATVLNYLREGAA